MSTVNPCATFVSINFLGGSPLNRFSWLRTSQVFVDAILRSSSTRWIVFKSGQPLVVSHKDKPKLRSLARLTTADVKPLLGPEPYLGQAQKDGDIASHGTSALEVARLRGPKIIFLGLEEPHGTTAILPSSDFSAKGGLPEVVAERVTGTPYFSLDVSDVEAPALDVVLQNNQLAKDGGQLEFSEARAAMNSMNWFDAAVFAEARSMVDWNARNRFCSSCGSPVYSLWAGWKLACTTLLPWEVKEGERQCASIGLNNFSHPRTDPVIITVLVNETGDKILLGRNAKCNLPFYSALAGFMEPGEAFEDSVKRESWEEAGVKVWDIKYHSSQPWPFPASLMVGFYATASESQEIRIDLDNELTDARWFTREEVLAVLNHPQGTNLSPMSTSKPGERDPPFRVPSKTAIAGVLISDWAHGKSLDAHSASPRL
ncbi:hypothetical protein BDM02DRAFT_3154769 [Thelephora ganbajun]|uniref:Uncharacterized protein n=1 Tax=Thelephora ganbajun TaxID=370292 RepID=A0ACB6ZL90_THEGA|nr:hypothetical protein BDM02DRAFT_3154769 [Thelephora ganbajun]